MCSHFSRNIHKGLTLLGSLQPIKYLYPIFTKTYLTGYCYFINIYEIFFIEIGSLCCENFVF